MTKEELIKCLEPFDGDLEIKVTIEGNHYDLAFIYEHKESYNREGPERHMIVIKIY